MRCSRQRCKARRAIGNLCMTHATLRADKLVGDLVKDRDQGCVVAGEHSGPLQWAHIIPRLYRAVRWDPANAVTMCAGHHTYFTHRPVEWEAFVDSYIGPEAHFDLKRRALATDVRARQVLAEVLERFEAAS